MVQAATVLKEELPTGETLVAVSPNVVSLIFIFLFPIIVIIVPYPNYSINFYIKEYFGRFNSLFLLD